MISDDHEEDETEQLIKDVNKYLRAAKAGKIEDLKGKDASDSSPESDITPTVEEVDLSKDLQVERIEDKLRGLQREVVAQVMTDNRTEHIKGELRRATDDTPIEYSLEIKLPGQTLLFEISIQLSRGRSLVVRRIIPVRCSNQEYLLSTEKIGIENDGSFRIFNNIPDPNIAALHPLAYNSSFNGQVNVDVPTQKAVNEFIGIMSSYSRYMHAPNA